MSKLKTHEHLCKMAIREPEQILQHETVSDLGHDALEAHRMRRELEEWIASEQDAASFGVVRALQRILDGTD